MRPDLGRLDGAVEGLQIGSLLSISGAVVRLAAGLSRWYKPAALEPHMTTMKTFRAAAMLAVLSGSLAIAAATPGLAQAPNINLIPELKSKTPEEREQDAINDKAYRESLRKIPNAKADADPWGNVRSDAPKATAPAKRSKTGTATN
jgi:hypothetical protein